MSLERVMEANHNRKKINGHLGVVDISADGEGGVSKWKRQCNFGTIAMCETDTKGEEGV